MITPMNKLSIKQLPSSITQKDLTKTLSETKLSVLTTSTSNMPTSTSLLKRNIVQSRKPSKITSTTQKALGYSSSQRNLESWLSTLLDLLPSPNSLSDLSKPSSFLRYQHFTKKHASKLKEMVPINSAQGKENAPGMLTHYSSTNLWPQNRTTPIFLT